MHAEAFMRRSFCTEALHTEKLLHAEALDTQKLLDREALSHRSFHTDKLLDTKAFAHTSSDTDKCLHTEAFTQKSVYTQKLSHTEIAAPKPDLDARAKKKKTILKRFEQGVLKKKIISAYIETRRWMEFDRHFVRKGCRGPVKIATSPQFWRSPSFRAKGLPQTRENHNFTSVFDDRPSFRAKRLPPKMLNPNFTSVFDIRPSFRAKRLLRTTENRNFTPFLTSNLHFVRKGCHPWKSQFYLRRLNLFIPTFLCLQINFFWLFGPWFWNLCWDGDDDMVAPAYFLRILLNQLHTL